MHSSFHQRIHPSTHPSIHPPTHSSIYPSIRPTRRMTCQRWQKGYWQHLADMEMKMEEMKMVRGKEEEEHEDGGVIRKGYLLRLINHASVNRLQSLVTCETRVRFRPELKNLFERSYSPCPSSSAILFLSLTASDYPRTSLRSSGVCECMLLGYLVNFLCVLSISSLKLKSEKESRGKSRLFLNTSFH